MFSYLMPARNASAHLRASVDSVLRMLKDGDELIVVEDASEDDTLKILMEYCDTSGRLIVVQNETRLGVARSLNAGLQVARNELVSRIDADDISLPWRRNLDWKQIEKGADFCFSSAILFGEGLRWPLPQMPRRRFRPGLLEELSVSNPFVHSTMTARKAAILYLGAYRETPAEDYDLWLRAARAGFKFSREPIPTVLYRVHPSQVTASPEWSASENDARVQLGLIRPESDSGKPAKRSFRGRILDWTRR